MNQGSIEVKTWRELIAVPWVAPDRNVGDPVPCPRWWVFNRRTGEVVGWIHQEPSGAFYTMGVCANTLWGAMAVFTGE